MAGNGYATVVLVCKLRGPPVEIPRGSQRLFPRNITIMYIYERFVAPRLVDWWQLAVTRDAAITTFAFAHRYVFMLSPDR